MVHIIVRRSEREMRERHHEQAPKWARGSVSNAYARGLEEADRLQRDRGRDNPNSGYILVDDVTAAESTKRTTERVMKERLGKDYEVV